VRKKVSGLPEHLDGALRIDGNNFWNGYALLNETFSPLSTRQNFFWQ